MSGPKVWFVTGASSGFGFLITEAALANGDKVVAALRKTEVLDKLAEKYPDTLLVLQLDVTNLYDIEPAFAKGKERFGRIDVVFNNAGYAILCEAERTSDKEARDIFEVLFWGAGKVSTVPLKYFRENNPIGGKLLQISSTWSTTAVPGPGVGYYAAAKSEIDPAWNIKIIIIQPGAFRTNILRDGKGDLDTSLPIHPAYTNPALATNGMRAFLPTYVLDGSTPKASQAFLKLVDLPSDEVPTHFPIHHAALGGVRTKAKALLAAADKWESWSEDVCW